MYTASPLSTIVRASTLVNRITNTSVSDSIFTHFLLLGLGDLRFLQRCFISTPPCWRAGAAGIPLPARGDSNRRVSRPPYQTPTLRRVVSHQVARRYSCACAMPPGWKGVLPRSPSGSTPAVVHISYPSIRSLSSNLLPMSSNVSEDFSS